MPSEGQAMTPEQLTALLNAALGSPSPLMFLDATVTALKVIGRHRDATDTAWVGCLYAEGEIELLLNLRAAWARGETPSPGEMARRVARRRPKVSDALVQREGLA